MNRCDDIIMKKCPICKREFVYNGMSVYKLKIGNSTKHYCSYTCWRKAGGGQKKIDPEIQKELMGISRRRSCK